MASNLRRSARLRKSLPVENTPSLIEEIPSISVPNEKPTNISILWSAVPKNHSIEHVELLVNGKKQGVLSPVLVKAFKGIPKADDEEVGILDINYIGPGRIYALSIVMSLVAGRVSHGEGEDPNFIAAATNNLIIHLLGQ